MDYSEYNRDYPFLLTHFRAVAKVLRDELISYREKGSKLSDAYVFGFSYGARLIVRAGDDIGNRQLGIMHCSYKANLNLMCLNIYIYIYDSFLCFFFSTYFIVVVDSI